jgi:hypothetical protein
MNVPMTLGAYALGLVAVFGGAAGVGNAVGPTGSNEAAQHTDGNHDTRDERQEQTMDHSQHDSVAATRSHEEPAGGLLISQGGYTFDAPEQLAAGNGTALSFHILGDDGRPVTAYEKAHDKYLHLIAVRRDLTGFQHVHPVLSGEGTWSVPLDLTPGTWRLFADFDPSGDDPALVLGADVEVAGDYQPRPMPAPAKTAVVDGYTVTLDGTLVPGRESRLALSVSRDGQPVTDLQPYLAAYGHLVALRDGDLAYLHVHPAGEPGDGRTPAGPTVDFHAIAPAGEFRLFFDFQHGDVVRTGEFTVRATDDTAEPAAPRATASVPDHESDGHAH